MRLQRRDSTASFMLSALLSLVLVSIGCRHPISSTSKPTGEDQGLDVANSVSSSVFPASVPYFWLSERNVRNAPRPRQLVQGNETANFNAALQGPDLKQRVLIFSDDFSAPSQRWDLKKYYYFPSRGATPAFLEDDALKLKLTKAIGDTAGHMVTATLMDRAIEKPQGFMGGYFEIKAKLNLHNSGHPDFLGRAGGYQAAFWLNAKQPCYNQLFEDGGCRDATEPYEIDIFEQYGAKPGIFEMTVHGGKDMAKGHDREHEAITLPETFFDDYHVYGLDWQKRKLVWYIDGHQVFQTDFVPAAPFYLMLNLYQGARMTPHLPVSGEFAIDYVRIYSGI